MHFLQSETCFKMDQMVDLTCNGMSSISTRGVVWKILFPLLEASSTTTTTIFRQQFCKDYLHRNHLCAHSIFIMIHPTRIKLLSAREILTCQWYISSSKVCSLQAIAKIDFFGTRPFHLLCKITEWSCCRKILFPFLEASSTTIYYYHLPAAVLQKLLAP